jgi:hypothetical protein
MPVGNKFKGYDCVYHRGRFYVLTMRGRLRCLDFGGPSEPWMEKVITKDDDDDNDDVMTRYLVSTPWGRLLQIRVILDKKQLNNVRVEIDRLDIKSRKMGMGSSDLVEPDFGSLTGGVHHMRDPLVSDSKSGKVRVRKVRGSGSQKMVGLSSAKALRGHSVFVGQNTSLLLSTKEFPELKPDCIYFTTPRLVDYNLFDKRYNEWKGVKVYDLKKRTLEAAFPSGGGDHDEAWCCPLKVWFTPSR